MAYWQRFAPYVPVALKEAKAARKLKKLQKKNPTIRPVILKGHAIAQSWWGKAWCRNLEGYADYSNRIGRGRSYVRHGAVLDLQIMPGRITALVQGSRERPYEVHINIDKLSPTTWRHIRGACEGRIDSLQTLLAGQFPKELGDLFMNQGQGLFPSPKEIHFECSCPDWASMCKHVAAVLYGVGARLDEEPALLFVLREATMDDLISKAVAAATRKLLDQANAESNGARVIADADLSSLFGIDLEGPGAPAVQPKAVPTKKRRAQKPESLAQVVKKKTRPDVPATPAVPKRRRIAVRAVPEAIVPAEPPKDAKKKRSVSAKTLALKAAPPKPAEGSDAEKIVKIIRRARPGVNVATLQRRTGLDAAKIRAIIYASLRKGLIQRVAWGLYKGA
jgi:uncharacterized Zn finger protein